LFLLLPLVGIGVLSIGFAQQLFLFLVDLLSSSAERWRNLPATQTVIFLT